MDARKVIATEDRCREIVRETLGSKPIEKYIRGIVQNILLHDAEIRNSLRGAADAE